MCSDVLKQHHHLARACARYKRELSNTFEEGEDAEGGEQEDLLSHHDIGSIYRNQHDNENEIIDLEADDNFDISKKTLTVVSAPSTYQTASATRHASFETDNGDPALYEIGSHDSKRLGLAPDATSRYNSVKSVNSVNSDKFVQQFAHAGNNDVAAIFESSHPHKHTKNTSKPMLESIISESNLPVQEDSTKFSVKYKPIPNVSILLSSCVLLRLDVSIDKLYSFLTITLAIIFAPYRVLSRPSRFCRLPKNRNRNKPR